MSDEYTRGIRHCLQRPPKDRLIREAMVEFLSLLRSVSSEFVVIGSTALQAHLPAARRLPQDFDVSLGEDSIEVIAGLVQARPGFRFERNDIASRIYFQEGFSIHLIPH